jgi:DNA polymerase III epsilon subunit-like protein
MTDWASLRYVVVDVEGNGARPPDLVELATVPIVRGVVGKQSSWLVRPETPIIGVARRIHGISNTAVADAPVFADIKDEVLRALDADGIVAHNAHVDVGVLQRKLGEWECPEVFDTLTLARRLLPEAGSHKLGALVQTFHLDDGLSDTLTPHRAPYDAIVTARLFVRLATGGDAGRLTLEQLRNPRAGGGEDDAPTLF